MSVLGNNVKRIRKQKNLSQEELAKRSGYSDKSTISCIESGKRDCSQRQIFAIANALEVSPGELFESRGVRKMDVKFTIEGAEETIKLLDKASSLIGELRAVVLELRGNIPDYPDIDVKNIEKKGREDEHSDF